MFAEMGEDGEPEFIPTSAYQYGPGHEVEHVVIPKREYGAVRALVQQTGIEEICRRLEDGDSVAQIARSLKIDRRELDRFMNLPENYQQALDAQRESGRYWDLAAEDAIDEIQDDSGPGTIAKAREKAAHYRWRAKAYQPKRYGDKVEHTVIPMPLNEVEERLKYLLENRG